MNECCETCAYYYALAVDGWCELDSVPVRDDTEACAAWRKRDE